MNELLIRLFLRNPGDVTSSQGRTAYGIFCGWYGILTNLVLCGIKVTVGILTGSIAVSADAVNNLSDAGSAVITLFGFKFADKPADDEHPFGHGRLEYVAGLIVAVIIIAVGLDFLKLSFERLIHPSRIEMTTAALAFLLAWIKAMLCDMENEPGDREMEHRTMPVKWGLRCSKLFLYGIIALTCAGLALAGMFGTPFDGTLTLRYIVFGQIVPLIVLAVLTGLSDSPSGYRQAITLTRFIMLTGMLYSLVFYYLQARTHGISLFGLFWVK